jgi:hypothetical protein
MARPRLRGDSRAAEGRRERAGRSSLDNLGGCTADRGGALSLGLFARPSPGRRGTWSIVRTWIWHAS